MSFRDQFQAYVRLARIDRACKNGFEDAKDVIPARLYARKEEVWPATEKSCQACESITLCDSDPHLSNHWQNKTTGQVGAQGKLLRLSV